MTPRSSSIALVLATANFLSAQGQWQPAKPMSRGPFRPFTAAVAGAPLLSEPTRLTGDSAHDLWPAIASGGGRRLAVAWVSFDDREDSVRCRVGRETGDTVSWGETETVATGGDYATPAVAFDAAGALWVVWSARVGDDFELMARQRTDSGWQTEMRLTDSLGPDWRLTLTPNGDELWLCWQGVNDGNFDIMAARLNTGGRGLTDVARLTTSAANDWRPTMAAGSDGRLHVAWDTFRNGNYDIYYCSRVEGSWSTPRPVVATPRREANASLAVAADGAVWVAYDVAEADWGRHVRLHLSRAIELRCISTDGVHVPPADFMRFLPEELQTKTELPRLAFDGDGRLHMVFSHFVPQVNKPPQTSDGRQKKRPKLNHGVFACYTATLTGDGWGGLRCLPDSTGRGDDRVRLVTMPAGRVWAAWATDHRQMPYYEVWMDHDIYATSLPADVSGAGSPRSGPLTKVEVQPGSPDPTLTRPHRPRVRLGDREYELVLGDTHRHTDLSRCGFGADGSLTDAYTYAIDVAALDFLSMGDHDQDLGGWRFAKPQPKLKGFGWWYAQKMADLHTIPGRFIGLYGYERGRVTEHGNGHKNIVYARRGYPMTFANDPADLWRSLAGRDAIVVPHQLADGPSTINWDLWGNRYERVAEIFQARGSYEYVKAPRSARKQKAGGTIWDAYSKGVHVGIIASSDHGLTHGAYAGVYSTAFSRTAIVDALRARRTYGATDPMQVECTVAGAPMGSEVKTDSVPRVFVRVAGQTPLARVEIVKNNAFILSRDVSGRSVDFTFQDRASQPGETAYYYVRVTSANDELAWTSPVWVKR